MNDGGCFAFLVAADHQLPRLVCQLDCTTFRFAEIVRPNLLIVHQRQYQPVRYQRAEVFHQVERQARPARPERVQEGKGGVETVGLQR